MGKYCVSLTEWDNEGKIVHDYEGEMTSPSIWVLAYKILSLLCRKYPSLKGRFSKTAWQYRPLMDGGSKIRRETNDFLRGNEYGLPRNGARVDIFLIEDDIPVNEHLYNNW